MGRNPKHEPRAGDVVTVGFDRREVVEITEGGAVRYRGNRYEGLCPLKMWWVWCLGRRAARLFEKAAPSEHSRGLLRSEGPRRHRG